MSEDSRPVIYPKLALLSMPPDLKAKIFERSSRGGKTVTLKKAEHLIQARKVFQGKCKAHREVKAARKKGRGSNQQPKVDTLSYREFKRMEELKSGKPRRISAPHGSFYCQVCHLIIPISAEMEKHLLCHKALIAKCPRCRTEHRLVCHSFHGIPAIRAKLVDESLKTKFL